MQEKLKEKFAAAPNQKKINALAEKQTPLSAGYRKALEPLRLEIEAWHIHDSHRQNLALTIRVLMSHTKHALKS